MAQSEPSTLPSGIRSETQGDHIQIVHSEVIAHTRVCPSIAHQKSVLSSDDMLAKRVG
jgi:hypothetical protein